MYVCTHTLRPSVVERHVQLAPARSTGYCRCYYARRGCAAVSSATSLRVFVTPASARRPVRPSLRIKMLLLLLHCLRGF
ncbi:hypothetical protein MRX96_004442 [Rhipicephalus microplus]